MNRLDMAVFAMLLGGGPAVAQPGDPPFGSGYAVGEPTGHVGVAVVHEDLDIAMRPITNRKPIRIEREYQLDNRGPERPLLLGYDDPSDAAKGFAASFDGVAIADVKVEKLESRPRSGDGVRTHPASRCRGLAPPRGAAGPARSAGVLRRLDGGAVERRPDRPPPLRLRRGSNAVVGGVQRPGHAGSPAARRVDGPGQRGAGRRRLAQPLLRAADERFRDRAPGRAWREAFGDSARDCRLVGRDDPVRVGGSEKWRRCRDGGGRRLGRGRVPGHLPRLSRRRRDAAERRQPRIRRRV